MVYGEINLEVSPVSSSSSSEEGGVNRAALCELEAAEALTGLARCRTLGSGASERNRAAEAAVGTSSVPFRIDHQLAQKFHGYAYAKTTSSERTGNAVENIPIQLCSTSGQSKSVGKSRQKPTKTEKEERKLRRILANRESARETIRRRKAMHLELIRKAADVLEENEILKKEKELAMDKYNSLKDKHGFLKSQLAKIKKAEQGEIREEPTTSSSQNPCPANITTPLFSHNQPSVVPCFWPSVLPSSEVFQLQCASGSNAMWSPQFPMPHRDVVGSHEGQENAREINRPGAPIFVVAVPWLLPCLAHSSPSDLHSGSNSRRNADSSVMHEENIRSSSEQYMNSESNSMRPQSVDGIRGVGFTHPPDGGAQHVVNHLMDNAVASHRPVESLRPTRNSHSDDPSGACLVSAPESTRPALSHRNQEPTISPSQKAKDSFAATEARRRRKELLRLKTIHCHQDSLNYSVG